MGEIGPSPQERRPWPLWLRVAAVTAIALALLLPLLLFHRQLFALFEEPEKLVAWVRSAGAWGPVIVIALAIAQTIAAPIPGQVVNFVSGYLYGLWSGMLYSWIGLVVGTGIAMAIGRYAGRPIVERIIGAKLLDRVDHVARNRGLGFFFLFFLIPGLPDDVLCFVAGMTTLPLRALVLISAVARIPGLLGSAWLGAYAYALPWQAWVALALLGLAATYLMWRHGGEAQDRLLSWLQKR